MKKDFVKQYGYRPEPVTPDQYFLGAGKLPVEEIQPDGQWEAYLPAYEAQSRGKFDSQNCTSYGTLNCLETLHRRLFNEEVNYSERYTGVMSGTTRFGNDPHKVVETIRKEAGLIPESELPFSENIDSWDEYYAPNPMDPAYIAHGMEFLRGMQISHEWVFIDESSIKTKQKLLKDALRFSPLGVSVRAWRLDPKSKLYTKRKGEQDTHWVMLFGYVEGKHWLIFDHYDKSVKKLHWDYDFGRAKRYAIERIQKPQNDNTELFRKIYALLLDIISLIAPQLGRKLRHER